MFNKMKRFMAILLSLTMLLSAMPMNALAETFSSGWTSAVDDGISLLADGNYTVRVGQTITIEGSSGYSHYWYVDDDAQNTGSVILTNTGSRTVRVEGVTEGTVTLVHSYRSNGRSRIQTFTVQVTALEASMQYIYLYVQVGGNTDGLTINSDGWYTVGYYVVSPVLEGYVASRLVVSGTMPANNVVYTVIYVPETETVEIDRDGVSLNIGSVVMNAGDCFE